MRKYGLIGYPLSHSFSPSYFAAKFEKYDITDARYDLYPLENASDLCKVLDQGVSGLNVTIPHKESVIPLLDAVDDAALAVGAVNTIKVTDGKTTGYNTDVYGFEQSLLSTCVDGLPQKALILGTGGAAKAVKYVLDQHDLESLYVSRSSGDILYDDVDEHVMREHLLVINTTPLGMYPKVDAMPDLPYEFVGKNHVFYDLVYNPEKTLFLTTGEQKGALIKNGKEMLELQADKAWEIWNSTVENKL